MTPKADNMTDPDSSNWSKWLGGGLFAGGFVGALLSKLHSRMIGPNDAQLKDLINRIDQLEVDRDTMDRNNQRALRVIMHKLREIQEQLPS